MVVCFTQRYIDNQDLNFKKTGWWKAVLIGISQTIAISNYIFGLKIFRRRKRDVKNMWIGNVPGMNGIGQKPRFNSF